jgi:hypothetical protein
MYFKSFLAVFIFSICAFFLFSCEDKKAKSPQDDIAFSDEDDDETINGDTPIIGDSDTPVIDAETEPDSDALVDPCEGVTCSGHGVCAVVGGDTAVCICDGGYHAAGGGLDCEANVAGDECNGILCSGHGTCLVVQGDPDYPLCVCDDDYHVIGNTNCVADGVAPADPCEGVTCSGHGECAVLGGDTAVCICDDGYHEEDHVTCILDSGTSADEWTRIADDAEVYHLSPDGVKSIYSRDGRKLYFWHRTKNEDTFLVQQKIDGRYAPTLLFFTPDSKYAILAKGKTDSMLGISVNLDTKEMVTLPAPCFPRGYVDQTRVVCMDNTVGAGSHAVIRIYNLETKAVTKVADLWSQSSFLSVHEVSGESYIVTQQVKTSAGTRLTAHRVSDNAKTQEIVLAEDLYQQQVRGVSSDGWMIYGQVDTVSGLNNPYVLYRASVTGGAPAQLLPGDGLFLAATVYGARVVVRRPDLPPVVVNADGSGTPTELSAIPSTDYNFSFFDDTTVLFYRENGKLQDLMIAKAPDWSPSLLADEVTSHEVRGGKIFVYRCATAEALCPLSVINTINDPKEILVAIDIKMSAPVDFSTMMKPDILPTSIDANGDSLLVNIQYFDVLHGNIPGPQNGFYWFATPTE